MNKSSVASKINRQRISAIFDVADSTITVEEAAIILRITTKEVAKLMSRWVEQGRFARIKRGLYAPIKPSAEDLPLFDPWIIATKVYNPCYIGALSAAEYWGLTDQKYPSIYVLGTRKPRNRNPIISNDIHISVRTISKQAMFGLESIIRQQTEVLISDPSRTIVDFMIDPQLGGGIHSVTGIFNMYLKSDYRNVDLLFSYAKKTLNGAVLKRLGYLLEHSKSGEFNVMALCRMLMTAGTIKLDPLLGGEKLITRWGIWI
jgi:predicted transcriptional regulator of viral defense system